MCVHAFLSNRRSNSIFSKEGTKRMNKKVKQNYEQLAQGTGLKFDEEFGVLYGNRGEYTFLIYAPNENYPYQLLIDASVTRTGGPLTGAECKQFSKATKPVSYLKQKGYALTMALKGVGNQDKLRARLDESLNALVRFLQTNGFVNCCQFSGQPAETDPYCVGNSYMLLSPEGFTSVSQSTSIVQQQKENKKENLVGGIVGALLGTLLGVASIIILSQLGYVAVISGIIMAVCTLKGYELLGGKLTKKGIVISVILMILMTYIGDRLDWAIMVMQELETDFASSYQIIPELISADIIDSGSYWLNLALVYAFVAGGAIPMIGAEIKSRSNESRLARIGAPRTTL